MQVLAGEKVVQAMLHQVGLLLSVLLLPMLLLAVLLAMLLFYMACH